MVIRHHVGMASTSRQTVIKSNDNMHRNEGWDGRDTGETQNLLKSGKEATIKNTPDAIFATEYISREIISRLSRPARNATSNSNNIGTVWYTIIRTLTYDCKHGSGEG